MYATDHLLEMISLNVEIYYNGAMCGDWQVNSTHPNQTVFHWLTASRAQLSLPDEFQFEPVELLQGDLVIFPKEIPHFIEPLDHLDQPAQFGAPYQSEMLESNFREWAAMLCGVVHFSHQGSIGLMSTLPEVIIISRKEQWIQPLLKLFIMENMKTEVENKSLNIINRLAELVFCEALRSHLSSHQSQGVLKLFAHEEFSGLVQQIAEDPSKDWNLETMASACFMSRTVFANKFKKTCDWTPNHYLTWWRMQAAWKLLRTGKSTIEVAELSGYASESSFVRVFQKEFKQTPSQVRKSLI